MKTFVALLALAALAGSLSFPASAGAQQLQSDETQRIGGKTFESLAHQAISTLSMPGDSELIQAAPVRDQIVEAGDAQLKVESPLVTPSYVNVPIDVDVNGIFIRTVFVGYRVQTYVKTAVASHDLVAGEVLTAADLKMARVEYYGRASNGTEVLLGRKVVVPFRKGAPIYVEETQTNQLVKPGSSVVLIVMDGGVSVVAEAVARTGGGLGEEVSVYNPSTNKMLSGTVVGPDRVELDILGVTQP